MSSTAASRAITKPGRGLATRVWAHQRGPAILLALTIGSQIAYPLTSGSARDRLTVATVLLWAAASLLHATVTRGRGYAALLLVTTAGIGFAAEAIGVATGVPFGDYHYGDSLGPMLAGVPVVIPLAWTMMAYPALLAGRRIGAPVITGTLSLVAWDLFLDPQMVAAGHWRFTGAGPRLSGIPLSNTFGWLLVSLLLITALSRLPEAVRAAVDPPDDRLMHVMFLWTYGSSVLAAAAFFSRPMVALIGGLVMGIPAGLLVRALRTRLHAVVMAGPPS